MHNAIDPGKKKQFHLRGHNLWIHRNPRWMTCASERSNKPESNSRIWPVAIGVFVLVLVAAVVWWLTRPKAIEVRTAIARDIASGGGERTVLNASGYVTARRAATASSKVTGKVVEVLIEEGMKVKEGQVLARLDDTERQSQPGCGAGSNWWRWRWYFKKKKKKNFYFSFTWFRYICSPSTRCRRTSEPHPPQARFDPDKGQYCAGRPPSASPRSFTRVSGNSKWLYELSNSNPVWVHPEDARRIGVELGDLIRITTDIGYFVNKTLGHRRHAPRRRRLLAPPGSLAAL